MNKKQYTTPRLHVQAMEPETMIATSNPKTVSGVEGTSNLSTQIDDSDKEEYYSGVVY